jgi:uncharacterized protein YndB with AHSA1/START domain
MAQVSKQQARPIRLERVYDGPVEDLWALWTTKEGLEEWYAPPGARIEVTALELRVGGAFEHVATAMSDNAIAYMDSVGRPRSTFVRGQFVEIVHHERLLIRYAIDFVPGAEPYPYDILVELHTEGERVRMVVTADAHPDAEMTRLAGQALAGQLNQCTAALAARAA